MGEAKMGGILAIVALINADVCNTGTRISRFGNYLRNNCLAQANRCCLQLPLPKVLILARPGQKQHHWVRK